MGTGRQQHSLTRLLLPMVLALISLLSLFVEDAVLARTLVLDKTRKLPHDGAPTQTARTRVTSERFPSLQARRRKESNDGTRISSETVYLKTATVHTPPPAGTAGNMLLSNSGPSAQVDKTRNSTTTNRKDPPVPLRTVAAQLMNREVSQYLSLRKIRSLQKARWNNSTSMEAVAEKTEKEATTRERGNQR